MTMRTNAGYTITQSIHIGSAEFVLGESSTDPAQFVTWACKDGDNYFWGHYMTDKLAALRDLLDRAGEELSLLEMRQAQKNERQQHRDYER